MCAKIFSAMPDDDHDVRNAGRLKTADAAFDYGSIAEGKERFEDAHAARASGGEQNCRYVIQVKVLNSSLRLWIYFAPLREI
jgi:hypothetical protein